MDNPAHTNSRHLHQFAGIGDSPSSGLEIIARRQSSVPSTKACDGSRNLGHRPGTDRGTAAVVSNSYYIWRSCWLAHVCRTGFAPARKQRLSTTHVKHGLELDIASNFSSSSYSPRGLGSSKSTRSVELRGPCVASTSFRAAFNLAMINLGITDLSAERENRVNILGKLCR